MKKYRTVRDFERDEPNLKDGQRVRIEQYGIAFTYETAKSYEELLGEPELGVGAMLNEDMLRLLGG